MNIMDMKIKTLFLILLTIFEIILNLNIRKGFAKIKAISVSSAFNLILYFKTEIFFIHYTVFIMLLNIFIIYFGGNNGRTNKRKNR